MAGRSRIGIWLGLGVAAALCGGGIWAYARITPYARIGSTYVAKQYCSCLFVAERSERDCRTEFRPDIDTFKVTVDRAALPRTATVTARLAVFRGEARYDQGLGCTVAR